MKPSQLLVELFKDKTIEEFLNLYHENEIFDIIEIILHYTVKLLKGKFNGKPSLNLIKRTLKGMCPSSLEMRLKKNNCEKSSTKHNYVTKEVQVTANKKRVSSAKIFLKPSSHWRKGDSSIFRGNLSVNFAKEGNNFYENQSEQVSQELTGKIYPEWWRSLMQDSSPKPEKSSKRIVLTKSFMSPNKFPRERPKINSENYSSEAKSFAKHRTFDKSVEANLESQSSTENRVQFDKKVILKADSDEKKNLVSPSYKVTSNSSSSNSSFFPSPEMKKFYQTEFKRLFGPNFIEDFARKKKN